MLPCKITAKLNNMPQINHLLDKIRETLEQPIRDLTVSKTARKANVSRVRIHQFLVGQGMSIPKLKRVANAVGYKLIFKVDVKRNKTRPHVKTTKSTAAPIGI